MQVCRSHISSFGIPKEAKGEFSPEMKVVLIYTVFLATFLLLLDMSALSHVLLSSIDNSCWLCVISLFIQKWLLPFPLIFSLSYILPVA